MASELVSQLSLDDEAILRHPWPLTSFYQSFWTKVALLKSPLSCTFNHYWDTEEFGGAVSHKSYGFSHNNTFTHSKVLEVTNRPCE